MFGGMNFFEAPRPFKTQYKCFSVSMMPGAHRENLEQGGKIIMPPSALDHLSRLNINWPMLFRLTNKSNNRTTHCGVLEFIADEGKIYIPYWMMQNLNIDEGSLLQVESVSLQTGTYAKFQPHDKSFIELSNPKVVLESVLRHFACLSKGDVIAIMYNNKQFNVSVLETKPDDAISVIECDLNVDFAAPIGYEEPTKSKEGGSKEATNDDFDEPMDVEGMLPEPKGFVAFSGSGSRLDGKKKRTISENEAAMAENAQKKTEYQRGIPDYDYQIGSLKFIRSRAKTADPSNGDDPDDDGFQPFKGEGNSLKSSRKP